MKSISDNSVDLIFFDPPFNLNKDYGDGIVDKMNNDEYLEYQYDLLRESKRILSDKGNLVYHNIPKWAIKIGSFLMDEGFVFNNWICWDEAGSTPTPSRLFPKHYPILWYSKTNKKIFNKQYTPVTRCRKCGCTIKDYGGKYKDLREVDGEKVTVLSDVWSDIHRIRHNKNKHRNSNELPIKLMDRIITMYSNKDSIVVDPFVGSGTTVESCIRLGRNFIVNDLSEEHIKTTVERQKVINQMKE